MPGAKFVVTAKEPKDDALGPQAKIVYGVVKKRANGATAAEVGEAISGKIETKQDPARVAAYYLQQFKADGLVKALPKEEVKKEKKAKKAKKEPVAA